MIKFDFKNPVNMSIASTAGFTAWANSGFSTDIKHVVLAVSTALTGAASPNISSSKPNISAESHIITPYANNVEPTN